MEEEASGGVLAILIGGNPSESSSELLRDLGLELGGMGGTGNSGMGLGRLGGFILEETIARFVLLYLARCWQAVFFAGLYV
jgi:hypothetical protein